MLKKEYYSIKELSKICDVPTYTIRFWESQISYLKPKKTLGNRRLYSKNEINFVNKINFYTKDMKISLKGVIELIKNNGLETFINNDNLFELETKGNKTIEEVIKNLKNLKSRISKD